MNKAPKGFEYHFPIVDFESTGANWYLNFEKMQLFIYRTGKIYRLYLNDDSDQHEEYLFAVIGDRIYKGDKEQIVGYFNYLAERELLE